MEKALLELKHSIRAHLIVHAGPTGQLAVFLTKVIDFLEDGDDTRRCSEMLNLSFSIVESIALFVQESIDRRASQAAAKGEQFPHHIRLKSDNLLIVVGKARSLPDKIVAKSAVLKETAEALRSLSTYTKVNYPNLTDSSGAVL